MGHAQFSVAADVRLNCRFQQLEDGVPARDQLDRHGPVGVAPGGGGSGSSSAGAGPEDGGGGGGREHSREGSLVHLEDSEQAQTERRRVLQLSC